MKDNTVGQTSTLSGTSSATPSEQQSQERGCEALTHEREQYKTFHKGISSQHTPFGAQPTVQGLWGIMWTPEPSAELGLPPWIPHGAKRTGTLSDSRHYFTHTGPFKVFFPQARPLKDHGCSKGLDSWPINQSVVRAGGLKPDEFYSVKQQPSVSWGYQQGFYEREDWTGICKAGFERLGLAARSDSGTESQPALTNAGIGVPRGHLLSVQTETSHRGG